MTCSDTCRIETLAALANTVRFYLIWRYYRDVVLYNLPKRHTIASFTSARFGTIYVLKKSLHGWRAPVFLLGESQNLISWSNDTRLCSPANANGPDILPRACANILSDSGAFSFPALPIFRRCRLISASWFVSLCFCAYWYRAAEVTACFLKTTKMRDVCSLPEADVWELFGTRFEKHNDYYFWDSFWLMYITTLTIGYGDITPLTHYGRVAAAFVTILGILIGSLLTASMMTNMEWSDGEITTLHILERAKAQDDVKALAINRLRRRFTEVIRKRRKAKRDSLRASGQPDEVVAAERMQEDPGYKSGCAGLKEVLWNGLQHIFSNSGMSERDELTSKLRGLQDELSKNIVDIQPDNFKFETIYARCKYIGLFVCFCLNSSVVCSCSPIVTWNICCGVQNARSRRYTLGSSSLRCSILS